jgi:hypothetical protein
MKPLSVTRVLAPFTGLDTVRPGVLEAACRRGTAVHTACLLHAQGIFVLDPEPEWQGLVESFRLWFGRHVDEVLAVEPELVHPKLHYVGHPDLILKLRYEEAPAICDLKTSRAKGRTWCGQLAAYKQLALANGFPRIGRTFSLRLKQDGGMPLADDYTYQDRDFAAFVSALTAVRYFQEV